MTYFDISIFTPAKWAVELMVISKPTLVISIPAPARGRRADPRAAHLLPISILAPAMGRLPEDLPELPDPEISIPAPARGGFIKRMCRRSFSSFQFPPHMETVLVHPSSMK